MATLDDFFGDGSAELVPECSFCGETEGELIVSVSDAYGPTHWHHADCKAEAAAEKVTRITPTWDEAMSGDKIEKVNVPDLLDLENTDTPDDLMPQIVAAKLAGVTVQAIHNAVKVGRISGYEDKDVAKFRPGRILVSRAEVERVWGKIKE